MLKKGNLQGYAGHGKGKTAAPPGVALRAAGAGISVLFSQLVKRGQYSEINVLKRLSDRIAICQNNNDYSIAREADKADIDCARNGLDEIVEFLERVIYKVVILDEANIALHHKLFNVDRLIKAINTRKSDCEKIITGRNAHQKLIDAADLVTEMCEIKHYYSNDVDARTGIEH